MFQNERKRPLYLLPYLAITYFFVHRYLRESGDDGLGNLLLVAVAITIIPTTIVIALIEIRKEHRLNPGPKIIESSIYLILITAIHFCSFVWTDEIKGQSQFEANNDQFFLNFRTNGKVEVHERFVDFGYFTTSRYQILGDTVVITDIQTSEYFLPDSFLINTDKMISLPNKRVAVLTPV